MFDPSRDQARTFFIQAWQKHQRKDVLTPLEVMVVQIITMHPEYHPDLTDPDALSRDFEIQAGRTNPFLHLSMHLAIAEQISIDQPPGIRAAHAKMAASVGEHEAIHEIMECLGQVIWESQRLGQPLNNDTYLELLNRRATKGTR